MIRRLKPSLNERDHVLGNRHAPLVLCEYGDYECPHCGAGHAVVKSLLRVFGEQLAFAFRHFPLTRSHPHALQAAEAAEAAGAQGKFWAMHDLLYTHQHALEPEDLERYAVAVSLDLDAFAADLDSQHHLPRIRHDVHAGALSGVNGTPTYFINGVRYDGRNDFDSLYLALASLVHAAQPGAPR